MKRFLKSITLAAALAVTAFTAPHAFAKSELTFEDYLTVSPDDVAYDQICTPRRLNVVYGESLIDEALDARFHFVKRSGQGNGLLIEFDDRCEGLQRGTATNSSLTNRCVGSRVRFEFFQTCRVDALYRVPNATSARAIALSIQVERARAEGMDLPEDPVLAARAFAAQFAETP
ncbi:MAG: hypothetical protein AAFQ22_15145 [Pseudomonadota bacterium]